MRDLLVGDYVRQHGSEDKYGLVAALYDNGTFYAVWYDGESVTWEYCPYDDAMRIEIMDMSDDTHLELLVAYVRRKNNR